MTEEEILEAMADIRDEKGYGGLAANNPTAASSNNGNSRQQEDAVEIKKSRHR